MSTAPRTNTKSPLARLCRWLYVRAITFSCVLVLMLMLVSVGVIALPADAEAAGTPPAATVAARHVISPGKARASVLAPLITGSGYFGGLTSKGWPVIVRVSRRGELVTQAVAGIEFTCTSGGSFAVSDKWRNLRIRARRFAEKGTGTFADGGMNFQSTNSIKGKLNRGRTRISGTLRSVFVQRNAAGTAVDTCDTGPLRFTVRR